MNERIRQLAEQLSPVATIGNWGRVEWADNIYPQIGNRMYASIDLEKFAELIVKECMSITDKCSTGPGLHDLFADNIIAEHFGVEE